MDRKQLMEVFPLSTELDQIELALKNFDNGGRIGSMVVLGASPDVPSGIVPTAEIDLRSINKTIQNGLIERRKIIVDKLGKLGVTV